MSSELIQVGNDIVAFKCYAAAVTTIFFYEYFLMLPDEIQYAQSSNKTWVFYLFLLNRYIPMAFLFWLLTVSYWKNSSQELCDITSFIPILTLIICATIAQIVLTLRIYAVTAKSRPIAATFAVITASQLAAGLYMVPPVSTPQATALTLIPSDNFRLCLMSRQRRTEIAYTAVPPVYDFLALLTVLYVVGRSTIRRESGVPGLLDTIAKDAMKYFLVIFTAHCVLAGTILFGRSTIQLLPFPGNIVYIPIMITRLIVSLRKATHLQGLPLSMVESVPGCSLDYETHSMRFAPNRGALNQRDADNTLSSITTGVS